MQLIQWLYFKNDTIYPRELIYYLCKYGNLIWIMGDNTFYIDQKCINLLCLHGHFDLFYYIYNDSKLFKREYIYDAFIKTQKKGLTSYTEYQYMILFNKEKPIKKDKFVLKVKHEYF